MGPLPGRLRHLDGLNVASAVRKILITTPWQSLSHEIRCFYVGKCLLEKGLDVLLLVHEDATFVRRLEALEGLDLECLTIRCSGGVPRLTEFKLDFYAGENVLDEFAKVEQVFETVRPDMVVSDAFPITSLVCERLGIRHGSFASASWTEYYGPERPSLRWDWIGRWLGGPVRRGIRRWTTRSFDRKLVLWARPLNRLARRLGLRERSTILSFVPGNDLTLITDVPEVGRLDNPPESFRYCGPIPWHPPFHSHELLERLDRSRKTLYVSFGSTGDVAVQENVARWLLEEGYQVVMAVPEQWGAAGDILRHPNLLGASLINAREVIPACDGVIFHGGVGTAYQALGCGKPSIAIPSHIEQYWNGFRLEEMGLGCLLDRRLVSRRRLLATVRRVLEDQGMRERLREISGRVPSTDGARTAADLVLEAMR